MSAERAAAAGGAAECRESPGDMLEEILEYNRNFVGEKRYMAYQAPKHPKRKMAVLSCMDTRLTHLLPAALGLSSGEVLLIKNAGGMIPSPWDAAVRSLLIAIAEQGVKVILVIGHTDCGVCGLKPEMVFRHLNHRGIPWETLERLDQEGPVSLSGWFTGFSHERQAVWDTAALLRAHPLVPRDVVIHGLIIHTETGELQPVFTR